MLRINQYQQLSQLPKILLLLKAVAVTILLVMQGCSILQRQSSQEKLALKQLKKLLSEKQFEVCLKEFQNIPQDFSIYSEAQEIMNKCAQSWLEQAKSYAKQIPSQSYIPATNNLDVAIGDAEQIPKESYIYEEAQNLIKQWNAEIQEIQSKEENDPANKKSSDFSFLEKSMLYSEARELLIDSGWQPANLNSVLDCSDCQVDPTVEYFVRKLNYTEIENCSGTGLGFCRFVFENSQGERLIVSTVGNQVDFYGEGKANIWDWWKEDKASE
jgi:hypothetical protein